MLIFHWILSEMIRRSTWPCHHDIERQAKFTSCPLCWHRGMLNLGLLCHDSQLQSCYRSPHLWKSVLSHKDSRIFEDECKVDGIGRSFPLAIYLVLIITKLCLTDRRSRTQRGRDYHCVDRGRLVSVFPPVSYFVFSTCFCFFFFFIGLEHTVLINIQARKWRRVTVPTTFPTTKQRAKKVLRSGTEMCSNGSWNIRNFIPEMLDGDGLERTVDPEDDGVKWLAEIRIHYPSLR